MLTVTRYHYDLITAECSQVGTRVHLACRKMHTKKCNYQGIHGYGDTDDSEDQPATTRTVSASGFAFDYKLDCVFCCDRIMKWHIEIGRPL